MAWICGILMPSGFLNKDGSLPSAEPRKKKKKLPPPPDFNFGDPNAGY